MNLIKNSSKIKMIIKISIAMALIYHLIAVAIAGCPPAAPCNTTVSYNGGSNGIVRDVEFGNTSGLVQFEFEAYIIPDAIKIYPKGQSTNILRSTSMVSGLHNLNFNWDPTKYGTTATVQVTGNSDVNTAWVFSSSCPGGPLQVSPLKQIVKFHWGTNPNNPATGAAYQCAFTLLIDDQVKKIVPLSQNYNYQLYLYRGKEHSYGYRNVTCQTTIGGGTYNTWIRIGNGPWTSGHPTPANNAGGVINL